VLHLVGQLLIYIPKIIFHISNKQTILRSLTSQRKLLPGSEIQLTDHLFSRKFICKGLLCISKTIFPTFEVYACLLQYLKVSSFMYCTLLYNFFSWNTFPPRRRWFHGTLVKQRYSIIYIYFLFIYLFIIVLRVAVLYS